MSSHHHRHTNPPPSTIADLHYNALCVDETDAGVSPHLPHPSLLPSHPLTTSQNVYNDAATTQACEWYFLRNKGDEWWNTCPDCVMITDGSPHCNSAAQHMGGDEVSIF